MPVNDNHMNRKEELHALLKLTPEAMLQQAQDRLEIVDTLDDLHRHLARDIADTIIANNREKAPTVLILPYGPTGQFPLFIDLVNRERITLKNCTFFFMDEYCDRQGNVLNPRCHLSFKGSMQQYWPQISEDLRLPDNRIIFPNESNIQYLDQWISEAGGIETCYGGIGIHGHIAFNEPEPDVSHTNPRLVELHPSTITMNAIRSEVGGDLENFPSSAYTLGMRQILSARKIRLYCRNDIPGIQWANAVLRLAVLGEPGDDYPVTHIRSHPDWKIITDVNTARPAKHVLVC